MLITSSLRKSQHAARNAILSILSRDYKVVSADGNGQSGLFSIPELREPKDFFVLSQRAIDSCNLLRTNIAIDCSEEKVAKKPQLQAILRQIDDISKEGRERKVQRGSFLISLLLHHAASL